MKSEQKIVKKHPDYLNYLNIQPWEQDTQQQNLMNNGSVESLAMTNISLPYPQYWNSRDKCSLLDLSRQFLRITYTGSGKTDSDAASVRTNTFVRPSQSIHYFETTIVSKGRDGYIGIGYCLGSVSLSRLPGWELLSFGYHGHDGNSFCCSGTGKPFGPKFTTGDIIGCGVNFHTGDIFYTKNGVYLGVAFKDFYKYLSQSGGNSRSSLQTSTVTRESVQLYPCIGLRTPGEIVESNFGMKPFKFDIITYIRDEKEKVSNLLYNLDCPLYERFDDIILNYLLYQGMRHTALAFAQQNGVDKSAKFKQQLQDCQIRKRIYDFILHGEIDSAIEIIDGNYSNNKSLNNQDENSIPLFKLKCRKFIELIYLAHSQDQTNSNQSTNYLEQALIYGQKLQEEVRFDDRPIIQNLLTDTFSLLAYPDPQNSPVSYLLESKGRHEVAEEVNQVLYNLSECNILSKTNSLKTSNEQLETSHLESTIQHLNQIIRELKDRNDGVVGLVDPQDFMQM